MQQLNSRFSTRRPWEEVNDADKQEVIRALALGYSVRQASKIVHRTPAVVFEWARTDAGFAAALNAIAADRDDEVTDFRERVRRAAGTMLDHLLDLADPKIDPITKLPTQPARERNAAVKTFFGELHTPMVLPRAAAPAAPTVLVQASQAAFLIAPNGAPTMPQTVAGGHNGSTRDDARREGGPHARAAQGRADRGDGAPGGEDDVLRHVGDGAGRDPGVQGTVGGDHAQDHSADGPPVVELIAERDGA